MFRFRATTTFIIHAAGWLLFLVFPLLFLNSNPKNSIGILLSSPYYWLFCLTYIGIFYLNTSYLIPQLFFRKKYVDYGIIVLVLFSFVYYFQPFDKLLKHHALKQPLIASDSAMIGPHPMPPGGDTLGAPSSNQMFGPLPHQDLRMQDPALKRPKGILQHYQDVDIVSLFLFFIITALSIATRTVKQWQNTEQKVMKAEAEKVNAELSFLKAQINPHFLFNTLNNIYTLSVMNSEHTSDSIMKLSNIMRYVTDDVTQKFVPLQDDIDCIQNYIDLQRLRLGSKTQVNFEVTGTITHQKIPPLIMMSFVENTFKYGISKKEFSTINIEIKVNSEQIIFCCENRKFNDKAGIQERTGIGIANTRQRLEHLYPKKHVLTIDTADDKFKVKLIINP
ncbi:histidine kinase [Mucilaginibacter robiniae]|uniref:Histidine kinase n=1 Tax=Mucilaginibacter robiniae TaxID=2728022 RepID=A0A7L5E3Q4_9SPHI|nr:histidine kinase [Mucilaginibacter robiniae]QJD96294.1 histidine kinase [Mucilaginibacter robiniae]